MSSSINIGLLTLGIVLITVTILGILIIRNESQRPLLQKITELQTNTDYDPSIIRNILNNTDPNITLEELIGLSQDAEKIYNTYIIQKYGDNAIMSFPTTHFFDDNIVSSGSRERSLLMESGDPEVINDVKFMVSTTFGANIVVNISMYGKIRIRKDLVFIADLNLHSRNQAQGIMVCNGLGSKFVTLCITPYFDMTENKLKSKVVVHPQGETGAISLDTGTDFYIQSSYKVYNENITSTDVNLDSYIIGQNTSYCR